MSVSLWMDQSGTGAPLEVDVCIIGAGLAGAATAWWLRDAGLDVAVVDGRDAACGASGRNGGLLGRGALRYLVLRIGALHGEAGIDETWHLAGENIRRLEVDLVGRGLECGYAPRAGSCSLAASGDELAALQALGPRIEALGGAVRTLDAATVERDFGVVGFCGAVVCDDGGAALDPARLVRGLLAQSGARVLLGEEVRRIEDGAAGAWVHTRLRRIRAERVVIAANAWAGALDPWLDARIERVGGQVLATGPVERFLPMPTYAFDPHAYFHQRADGRVVIGGCNQAATGPARGGFEAQHPEIQAALGGFVRAHLPRAAAAPVEHAWGGVMGYTADARPLVGAIPGRPGVYCIAGFSGNGLSRFLEAGRMLAEVMRGGAEPVRAWSTARWVG